MNGVYTVHFLSDGNSAAANVRLCDLVPDDTTYESGSLQLSPGTAASPTVLTDDNADIDPGRFFDNTVAPVAPPCIGSNTDGGVYVELADDLLNAIAARPQVNPMAL